MMMKFIQIFIFSFVATFSICGQGLQQVSKEDSTPVKPPIYNTQLFITSPILSLPFAFSTVHNNYPESLHLKFGSSSNLNSIIEQNLDVSEIWKIGKLKDDELKTLRSILGSVQLGGVAYLAYKHIKKYGLK
ncbi:MAG: hypothetical protein M0P61_04575 [Ignavibacteriaceae bacterium]|nr:hypothetical protein [Ignavibacteriaceae bacterium]